MLRFASLIALLLFAPLLVAQRTLQNRNWNVGIWLAGATGQEDRSTLLQAQTWASGIYIGRIITADAGKGCLRGQLEYGFNIVPLFASSGPNPVYGGGFEPIVLHWHFVGMRRIIPYLEVGGGGIFTTGNFPHADTSNFNFTTRGGGGIQIITAPRHAWDVGLQYLHISNANLGNDNPAFNGVQVRIGYHWYK